MAVIHKHLLVPVITLVAVGAVLFAIGLDAHEIGRDEAVSIFVARLTVPQALELLANHEPNPAGHFLLLHFWPHDTALQARLLSYFPALAVPPLIFLIARQLSLPAWTAGLLAATSPFLAYYAEEARGYVWLVLAGAAALSLTVRALSPLPSVAGLAVLLGAVLAAGLYVHYFAVFTALAVVTALLLYRQYRRAVTVAGVAAVLFLPGAVMLVHQIVVFRQNLAGGWQTRIDAGGLVETFSLLLAGTPDYKPGIALAACFALATILALRRFKLATLQLLAIFIGWSIVLPLLVGVLVPFLTPRYLAASVPGLLLLTATGVRTLPPKAAGVATVLLALASTALIVEATTRFDGQKLQIKEGLALARVEGAHPVVHGYLFAPSVAFYAAGEVAYSFDPPPVDYYGLFALPAGAPYPPRDRRPILFFDYCDLPPPSLEGYSLEKRTPYPGRLCYDLETVTPSQAPVSSAARTRQPALASGGVVWPRAS